MIDFSTIVLFALWIDSVAFAFFIIKRSLSWLFVVLIAADAGMKVAACHRHSIFVGAIVAGGFFTFVGFWEMLKENFPRELRVGGCILVLCSLTPANLLWQALAGAMYAAGVLLSLRRFEASWLARLDKEG